MTRPLFDDDPQLELPLPKRRTPILSKHALEQKLSRGRFLNQQLFAGLLRPGITPAHAARALSALLEMLGRLFVDVDEIETNRTRRWKELGAVCEEAAHQLVQAQLAMRTGNARVSRLFRKGMAMVRRLPTGTPEEP